MGNLLNSSAKTVKDKLNSDELTPKCCHEISYKIGSDWLQWGRSLGLSDAELNSINSDNIKCYEKAYKVLNKWKQINGNPSWKQLKKELISFDRLDIVSEIERNFKDLSTDKTRYATMLIDLYKKNISYKNAPLKAFYAEKYGKVDVPRLNLNFPYSVDILNEFVELCLVDARDVQRDLAHCFELKELLKKQKNYKAIQYNEVFKEETDVLLITGIAGIGKSWLLKNFLLDWSNNCIWKNVDFIFYFECRMLNRYQNISNIKELLEVFYKDFVKDLDIHNHNVVFMIDGLDELKYLDDLINYFSSSQYPQYPIVNTLAEIQNFKSVVAGRVYAIDRYQSVYRMPTVNNEKLTIQIMGFNDVGVDNYIESNVIEEKKKLVKSFFKDTSIAKAMASVPFYLSRMCEIVAESKERDFSILTMTDLYTSIFLHFLKTHISKNEIPIYEMMENENNKKSVLNICKIAYELFVENKVIFYKEEMQMIISDFDEVEDKLFGFIEIIETHLGHIYQFAHLTIIDFCASVYAYNNFSGEEIVVNEKLRSCLSMICGLTNKSQNSLLKFLVNLNNTNKKQISIDNICIKRIVRNRCLNGKSESSVDESTFVFKFYFDICNHIQCYVYQTLILV